MMQWRKYIRLSYAETREFSERRSVVGIVVIAVVCVLAGAMSLLVHGKLKTCIPIYKPAFDKPQIESGGEGCQGASVGVGQLLYGSTFTYVVVQGLDQYRSESLTCSIQQKGATINVISFAAPQFLWAYTISCKRPATCCPKEIEKEMTVETSCFCEQTLELHIQDFRRVSNAGSYSFNGSGIIANSTYSSGVDGTIATIDVRTCPNGDPISVLRFDSTTYSVFSSSQMCYGSSAGTATSGNITTVVNNIRTSVDAAILTDLSQHLLDSNASNINYLCYSCSFTSDFSQLLLDFFIAIFAIGSMAYSLVLWVLQKTQRQEPSTHVDTSDVELAKINSSKRGSRHDM